MENRVVSNQTYATHPDGELHILVKQQAGTGLSFKDPILEICGRRKDAWAGQVEVRLQGAISDLHAAEARYRESCRKSFVLFRIKKAGCLHK